MTEQPSFLEDATAVARELGDAMRTGSFGLLLRRLDQYEVAFLRASVDDPSMSKDFQAGFVSAIRQIVSDLNSCEQFARLEANREAAEELAKERSVADFIPPGGGPDRGSTT
jgi:hypothetical protein